MNIDMRKPTEADLVRFKECLAVDADHGKQDMDAWTAAPGEFWTFYDEQENKVWVRIERVLRVSIQHDPAVARNRQASLFYKAFFWLAGSARSSGFTEVIFESRAVRLIRFVKKLFGVLPLEDTYSLCVARPTLKKV